MIELQRAAAVRPPSLGKVLVEDRKGDVGQQRRQDATLGSAGGGVSDDAVLTEDARMTKRFHNSACRLQSC
jgi:hypothetical protein